MTSRANPFYQYRNPALGNMFAGLAEAMFPAPQATTKGTDPSAAAENYAQAQANYSLAEERDQSARGKRIKNDRYAGSPTDLANLFLSGGRLQDEPLMVNPAALAERPPTNFDLLAPAPEPTPPAFTGRTAVDQLAAALQQMEAYGFRPDQMMDAIGKLQYLNAAGGPDPQSGLPFAPFVGVNPNAGTALSPDAQGQISMRDSNESIAQALTTAIQQGENSANVARINQAGADRRNNANIAARSDGTGTGGTKPATVPTVSPTTARAIMSAVEATALNAGMTLDPEARDFIATEATRRYQDPESDGFKNVQGAVLSVVDDMAGGVLDGVTSQEQQPGFLRRMLGAESTTRVSRSPAAEDPTIAAARSAIAQGAPREAVIKRLKDNGITPPKDL